MSEPSIPASVFKARCLALLDEVAITHRSFVVTKHGVPVARVVPMERAAPATGSVTLLVNDDADYFSSDLTEEGDWDGVR